MKQAAKKEDTKQRILDEALRLFSQSGCAAHIDANQKPGDI